jgi:hypothetical protein
MLLHSNVQIPINADGEYKNELHAIACIQNMQKWMLELAILAVHSCSCS